MRDADPERAAFRRGLRRRETEAERKLWLRLRDRRLAGLKFVRQESIGPYIADFACRETKLIVELDGSQHANSERDRVRDAWIVDRGYRVMRFWNHDVLNGIETVLETILSAQSKNAPKMVCVPLAPPAGRGPCLPLAGEHGEAAAEGEGAATGAPYPPAPPHLRSARRADDEVVAALSPPGGERGHAHAIDTQPAGRVAAEGACTS